MFNSNINTPIVNNEIVNNITAGYDPNKTTARIFFIAPRFVTDTFKRPHQYNFTHQFLADVSEVAQRTVNGNDFDFQRASYMNSSQAALGAVMPSIDNGFHMNNKVLRISGHLYSR